MEETGKLFGWTEPDKLIIAEKSLEGLVKIFVQGEGDLTTWKRLKEVLCEEFGEKLNSVDLYCLLMSRKEDIKGSSLEYLLKMKVIASRDEIEESALVQYVIDEIDVLINIYGTTGIKDLKTKLYCHEKYFQKY